MDSNPRLYEWLISNNLRRLRNGTMPLDRGFWDNLWHERCTLARETSYISTALLCLRYTWYAYTKQRLTDDTMPLDRGFWDNVWHARCTIAREPSYLRTALLCLRYTWYAHSNLFAGPALRLLTSLALVGEQRNQKTAPLFVARKLPFVCKRCETGADAGYFCQSCGSLVCSRCLSYKRGFLYPLFCADCELPKHVLCKCCERMVAKKYICQRCKRWTCEDCLSFQRRWNAPLCETCNQESYDSTSSETASTKSLPDYETASCLNATLHA